MKSKTLFVINKNLINNGLLIALANSHKKKMQFELNLKFKKRQLK